MNPQPAPPTAGPVTRDAAGPVGVLAIVCVGLMAGLFLAFAIAVMPGLARTDDRTFVATMQSVNRAIENLPFAATFFGAFVLPGVAAFLRHRAGAAAAARWTLASLALYVVALAVTFGVNIPLNGMLDGVDLADAGRLAAARAEFEGPWTAANVARSLACTLAVACLAQARSARTGR